MTVSHSLLCELQDVLSHLHDPDLQPGEEVCRLLGCTPQVSAVTVQDLLIEGIAGLAPAPEAPPTSHCRRVYELLQSRYVLGLSQDETAARLHVSRSTVQRTQREAIHALARALCQRREEVGKQSDDWEAQARREIASVEAGGKAPGCDVAVVVQGVVALQSAVAAPHGTKLVVGHVQPHLVAAVHPAVLRQSLVTAVGRVARFTDCKVITLFAGIEDGNVQITLVAPDGESGGDLSAIAHGILLDETMHVDIQAEGGHLFLRLTAPTAEKLTVLVVDDNPDIAEFYRRALEGTAFAVAHTRDGRRLFDLIQSLGPRVIVLDVMLPDVDGWELLMRLHENPATRNIPVIVCSVVREEALALSLGATMHLAKPIEPRTLRDALDRALSPPSGALPENQAR